MINIYAKLIVLALCVIATKAFAQLPPVIFPSGTYVCDYTPWKLVFYDGFDGTSINTNKWYTFNSNNSGTTDDWGEGRKPYPNNHSIIRDENIIVNEGTLKLKIIQKNNTWQCATCGDPAITENYTTGYISSKTTYNNGKIETRLKMPIFKGAWSTCWFYFSSSINEIDFVEASSPKGILNWPHIGNRPNNSYNLHAYAPREIPGTNTNPYNLADPATIGNSYPNQSWWQWFWNTNNRHHYEDWHTYTCEWDTASIKTYLDGSLVKTIWKYYQIKLVGFYINDIYVLYPVKTPSGCFPSPGSWHITEGFPYNNTSLSKLIFSTAMSIPEKILTNDGELGQMEIDYVKIWQRHPEQDNHSEICRDPIPVITGPTSMCGITTYETSPNVSGGTWSSSNNGAIVIIGGGGSSNGTANVYANANSLYTSTILSYTYTPTDCPPVTISKQIHTGTSFANVLVSRNWHWFTEEFNLVATPSLPNTTYSWEVWYGFNSNNLHYYQATGPNITTPSMVHWSFVPYYLKWKLTIINSCGAKTIQGTKNNMSYLMPLLANPSTFMEKDSSVLYMETRFTIADSLNYEKAVSDIISTRFVEDLNDTISIANMIEQIRTEALEPYLFFADKDPTKAIMAKFNIDSNNVSTNLSTVYPNPALQLINIQLSDKFNRNEKIRYKIFDFIGKLMTVGVLEGDIDIANLASGSYVVYLYQAEYSEHCKFTKK